MVFSSVKKYSLARLFLLGIFFAITPTITHAATLNISPSSGTYTVGQTFSVSISASSSAQTLNAATASISYSRDTMEIISVSKSPSIFSLWVQEPSYSNQSGIASFEGVVLNPGFIGGSGKLITYSFRVKAPGNGFVRVSNGSILANDGNGTDIFTGAGSASYTFATGQVPVKPATPLTPVLVDGELPPILQIHEVVRDDLTHPTVSFVIAVVNTKDAYKKFQIKIDQGEPIVWENAGDGIFTTPNLDPGTHTILVKTLDGKKIVTGYADFLVDSLQQPKIIYHSKLSSVADPVVVYGTARAGETVTTAFKNGSEVVYSGDVAADSNGAFIMIASQKVPRGVYTVDVFVKNDSGARSPAIVGINTRIVSNYYVKIASAIIDGYMLAFILCVIGLLVVIWELFGHKKHIPITVIEKPVRKRKVKMLE